MDVSLSGDLGFKALVSFDFPFYSNREWDERTIHVGVERNCVCAYDIYRISIRGHC